MGRGRLGNPHQKQPATAAGGKACGGLLQHIHRGQHLNADTQPEPAETTSSAHHVLLQGGSHRDLRVCLFKLIWMLYSSNLSERRDIINKSHHSEARGEKRAAQGPVSAGTGRTVS